MTKKAMPSDLLSVSATSRAYSGIIELVLHHALRPGERTSVGILSKRLGLGRTPVKEAITRLQTEGLLSVAGRSGTMVNLVDTKQAEHLFALRKVLEDFAAEEAVKHATDEQIAKVESLAKAMRKQSLDRHDGLRSTADFLRSNLEFHALIVAATGNELLLRIYNQIQMQMQIVTYLVWHDYDVKAAERRQIEHEEIANALAARDARKLKASLHAHSQAAAGIILATLITRNRFESGNDRNGQMTA
jgi:DNA-binding GntR family transcriptional regulator